MLPEEKRKPPKAQQSPIDQNRKSTWEGSKIQSRETFLFEQRLDFQDVESKRIQIPWEKAEKYFPPHTPGSFLHRDRVLISDTQNESWPMRISNYPLNKQYGIEVGWREFASKHNLEAMDAVRFYRPRDPTERYHYLVKCEKSTEKKAEGIVIGKQKQTEVVDQRELPGETDVKINGFPLKFLFQKKLTRADVTQKCLRIPTEEAKKHFPPLAEKPDGSFKDEEIKVYDPRGRWRWMKIRFSGFLGGYVIAGEIWSDYVSMHELREKDVIRFFKVVNHVPGGKHYYYVDYLRAKEANPSGKGGGGSSKKRGRWW